MIHESTSLSQTTEGTSYILGEDNLQPMNLTQEHSCHDTRVFF